MVYNVEKKSSLKLILKTLGYVEPKLQFTLYVAVSKFSCNIKSVLNGHELYWTKTTNQIFAKFKAIHIFPAHFERQSTLKVALKTAIKKHKIRKTCFCDKNTTRTRRHFIIKILRTCRC